MKETPGIDLIDLDTRIVLLTDGTILPITDFLDLEGEGCDPRDAVVCIAGNDEFGWIDIEILPSDGRLTLH